MRMKLTLLRSPLLKVSFQVDSPCRTKIKGVELFCDTVDATFEGPCAETAKGRGRKMAAAMQRLLAGVSASGAAPIEPTWRHTEASADNV